ncbi:uncharacterized protein LOC144168904 [Haemaphysalis longicornis]
MSSSRAPRTMWTDDEIMTLLALVHQKKLSDLLDTNRQKKTDIFMDLERCHKELGLQWTWEQIRTCWNNLKKRFTAERLLMCKSGAEPSKWKWFDKMNLLLGDHPMVQARDYGVDTAAEDEDSVLLCDGSGEEEGAADDLETSATSTPSQGGPGPSGTQGGTLTPDESLPPKRRRTTTFEKALDKMYEKNIEQKEMQNKMRFEMERELLRKEHENTKELLAGVTNSFLQGTQALLGQFFAQQATLLSSLQGMQTSPAQIPPFIPYLPEHSRIPRQ